MSVNYPPPVNKLLKLGDPRKSRGWLNYLELGIGSENVPDLVLMATDKELNFADPKSLEVWAPLHAWRALGQLRAEEAVEPLIQLFHELKDDDWSREELPTIFGMIGRAALPSLKNYLADSSHGAFPRDLSADSIERIAQNDPESRTECIEILNHQLELYKENDPLLNGFLISHLIDLKAFEALPTIERAFADNCVDPWIAGNWEDVQIEFGLKERKEAPRKSLFFSGLNLKGQQSTSGAKKSKKAKSKSKSKARIKRKMAKGSRRKNRKRK